MVSVGGSIIFFLLLGSRSEHPMIIGSIFLKLDPGTIFLVLWQNSSIQMLTYLLKYIEQQAFKPKSVVGSVNEQNCVMTLILQIKTSLLHINHSQAALYSHWFSCTMSDTPEHWQKGHGGVFFTNKQLQGPNVSKKLSLLRKLHILLILGPKNQNFSYLGAPLLTTTLNK